MTQSPVMDHWSDPLVIRSWPHNPEWAVASPSLPFPELQEKTCTVSIFSLTGANHFTGNNTRDKDVIKLRKSFCAHFWPGSYTSYYTPFSTHGSALLSSSPLLSSFFYCLWTFTAIKMLTNRPWNWSCCFPRCFSKHGVACSKHGGGAVGHSWPG